MVAPPRPRSTAERLLLERDWMRIEDAYEQLDADEQTALDLAFGLKPGDARRRSLAEIADRLDIGQVAAAATLARAVKRLDALL